MQALDPAVELRLLLRGVRPRGEVARHLASHCWPQVGCGRLRHRLDRAAHGLERAVAEVTHPLTQEQCDSLGGGGSLQSDLGYGFAVEVEQLHGLRDPVTLADSTSGRCPSDQQVERLQPQGARVTRELPRSDLVDDREALAVDL